MTTIVTRAGKGSPLTHAEVDANFNNLNNDKAELNSPTFTGTVSLPVAVVSAGTVSAPALTTTGDTNTGIFFPAADTIAFTEGGAEAMRINSSGNVGIGTSSPNAKLDVVGGNMAVLSNTAATAATASTYALWVGNSATRDITLGSDATYAYIQSWSGKHLYLNNQGNNVLIGSGNVGIGTSSPDTPLKVVNSTNGIIKVKGGSSTNQSGAFFVEAANSTNTLAAFGDSSRIIGGTPDQAVMIYAAAVPITFYSNSAERMRIDSSGNLLVGTTASGVTGKINVVNTVRVADAASETNALLTTVTSTTSTIETRYSTPLVFGTNATERMRITSTGNVGIGTSSPVASLHVAGAIGASPAGTGFMAGMQSNYAVAHLNGSDGGLIDFSVSGTDTRGRIIYTNSTNAMGFGTTDGVTKMTLDSSGNLGLGVTPSAWGSGFSAIDIGGNSRISGLTSMLIGNNLFFNGTNWIYKTSAAGAAYVMPNAGGHQWFTAPSGTSGNTATLTQAMTLDASGNLLVGTTTATKNLRLNQKLAVVHAGSLTYAGMALTGYSGTSATARPVLDFNRSRGTTDGSMTVVASGDDLGTIVFRGADGTDFQDSVAISAQVDGTPGANDMPGRLVFYTASDGSTAVAERMRIDSNGNLLVGITSARANAGDVQVSKGISFPATQSAQSDANTLDDYEEGTWTPTVAGSTTAGTTTYTTQAGTYVKVGSMVYCQATLIWTAATGTGNLRFGGLPFTSVDITNAQHSATFGVVDAVALTANNIMTGVLPALSTTIIAYSTPVGGGGYNDVAIDGAGYVSYSIVYRAT